MRTIVLTKKQETIRLDSNEYIKVQNCNQIMNSSRHDASFSFEEITASEVGGTFPSNSLVVCPTGTTDIYIKGTSKTTHLEAFGV